MPVKRTHMQFTCVTCSLLVKTGNFTCSYAASTSRRIHAIALNKACKLRVTLPGGCRLTYFQFAADFACGVIADCPQIQLILCAIAGIFACNCVGIFACDSSIFACKLDVFCMQKQAILQASRGKNCMSSVSKITCKIPVVFRSIYMRLQTLRVYSARGACRVDVGKFTCFYK